MQIQAPVSGHPFRDGGVGHAEHHCPICDAQLELVELSDNLVARAVALIGLPMPGEVLRWDQRMLQRLEHVGFRIRGLGGAHDRVVVMVRWQAPPSPALVRQSIDDVAPAMTTCTWFPAETRILVLPGDAGLDVVALVRLVEGVLQPLHRRHAIDHVVIRAVVG